MLPLKLNSYNYVRIRNDEYLLSWLAIVDIEGFPGSSELFTFIVGQVGEEGTSDSKAKH